MSLSFRSIILEVDPDRNRIYLGGHRQGARQLSLDLHLPVSSHSRMTRMCKDERRPRQIKLKLLQVWPGVQSFAIKGPPERINGESWLRNGGTAILECGGENR